MPNGRRIKGERPKLTVTHDDDGGITVKCPQSGMVFSIIETHPSALGPKGAFVEAYAYEMKHEVLVQNVPTNRNHPTTAYYAVPRKEADPT